MNNKNELINNVLLEIVNLQNELYLIHAKLVGIKHQLMEAKELD